MQFVETMLAGLFSVYKVVFQGNHGVRNPNGVVASALFFKDAVGLLETPADSGSSARKNQPVVCDA